MNADENEKPAVRTTIVGGRPPGSGRNTGTIPRGIEVLVKKAAIDREFCELLLDKRAEAASSIELTLDSAESAMLSVIPREQLAQIVVQTQVPVEQRRVFLGRVAAAMLVSLGAGVAGCERGAPAGIAPDAPKTNAPSKTSYGIQPDQPGGPTTNGIIRIGGIRPDPPKTNPPAPAPTRGIQPDRPPIKPTNPPPITLGIQPDLPPGTK